jgi:hypothetical protein
MIMNEPARQGTILPWHQDGGDDWKLDRDPLVTIWVALDPATTANGCLEVVPGTHRLGLLTDEGGTLGDADAERHCPLERRRPLELDPGHGVLLHNWLIHRSGVNPSSRSRRAFTACYLDGRTRGTLTGAHYPFVADSRPPAEYHFVAEIQRDRMALRESLESSGAYARSLQEHAAVLEAQAGEATAYARSLEARAGDATAYARTLESEVGEATAYARSLEAEVGEATAYARSLEAEVARLRAAHEALGRESSGGQG